MATTPLIDWDSLHNEVLLNPRMPMEDQARMLKILQENDLGEGQFLMTTSGSSGSLKWVVLPKEGILKSAEAVNRHLQSSRHDRWFNSLPVFHVGGLGIWARAHLSGVPVVPFVQERWNVHQFFKQLTASQATLTALVPTQIFDLVSNKIKPPLSLRAMIVGGGVLHESLYREAIVLGWPLLPSYGLTECASQVATAPLESWSMDQYPLLQPLDHVELALTSEGKLKIKSPSLLTSYIYSSGQLNDPKIEGWFTTEDHAVLANGMVKSISRDQQFVKIGGENVDLNRLEGIFEEEKMRMGHDDDMVLMAVPDPRLGHAIHLVVVTEDGFDVQSLVEKYQQRVFPYERIRQVHRVMEIPRSSLKKVLRSDLLALLH